MSARIVVLDGYTLNPGDLSWTALEKLGECQIYERSGAQEIARRSRGAEVLLTNKTPLDRGLIQSLRDLRYIGVLATGYNIVDIEAARERRIPVCNVPAYGTGSVAQMTLALLLELTQRVGDHSASVRAGAWNQCVDFCYWRHPLVELDGLTMGIIGYGRIGKAVGHLARAFGMKVIAPKRAGAQTDAGAEWTSLDALFQRSDVVSLHCPLTPDTAGLVDARRLARMKPTAFLLNTSRGPLVDEQALAAALNRGEIAGAGLDVLGREPPRYDSPLYRARNCFITPHIAWATRAARERLMNIAIENVRQFLEERPQNVVNSPQETRP